MHKHPHNYCMRAGTHGCPHAFTNSTRTHKHTRTRIHRDRMKNACCKLSARSLSLIPHHSPHPIGTTSPLSPIHIHFLFPQLWGSSIMWRCLVNLVLLCGTDTQLVVGALTRPKKKRLELLQTGAVNRNRMGCIGLQGLSYFSDNTAHLSR